MTIRPMQLHCNYQVEFFHIFHLNDEKVPIQSRESHILVILTEILTKIQQYRCVVLNTYHTFYIA
jgi:hypothetical protein